MLAVKYEKKNS